MATQDNFYAVAQMFALGLVFLILWVLWANLTTTEMDETIWSQSSIGMGVKNNGQAVMDNLDFIFLMAYFGLHIGIIVLAFLLRSHPVVLVAGIFLIVVLIIISVPLSNTWEELTQNGDFLTYSAELPKTNYLLKQMPIFETIWGFLTLIMLGAFARGEDYI